VMMAMDDTPVTPPARPAPRQMNALLVKTTCSLMVEVLSESSVKMENTWTQPMKYVGTEMENVLDHVHTSWNVLNDLPIKF